jgi:hypothetical protein
MTTLNDFYSELLTREGVPYQQLISCWDVALITRVEQAFRTAVQNSGIKNQPFHFKSGSSNQSWGNQVEDHFVAIISQHLKNFMIGECVGKGYPDRCLRETDAGSACPLEIKATSQWNPQDTNRRVLTSSSAKLRANFAPPVQHLLATVQYSVANHTSNITAIRLDFLEPTTLVNIRLEASVTHQILAQGTHTSVTI